MGKTLPKATIAVAALAASFLLDNSAANLIKGVKTPLLDLAAIAFDKHFILIYAALLAATAAVVLKKEAKENRTKAIFALAAALATTIAATYLLKFVFQRERPAGTSLKTLFGAEDYSFPSAHVALTAAATAMVWQKMRVAWVLFTAATVFSRLYLNAHFLSDTVGGFVIAAALSAFVKSKLKEKLAADDRIEVRRQLMHALIGAGIALFIWKYQSLWYVVLAIAAAGAALAYTIRLTAAAKNVAIKALRKNAVAALGIVERKEAAQKFPGKGAITLFLGSGITAAVFEREIAVAAILILAIGDSVSHLAGRLFGKVRHKWIFADEKMVEGTIIGIIFAAAAAATILPVWKAIAASAAGMLVEALRIRIAGKKIDDNLSVPLVAAAVLWALRLV